MSCFGSKANKHIRIKKPNGSVLKAGHLQYYDHGLVSNEWKNGFFILFDDSGLIWYRDKHRHHHIGGVRLEMVANYLAVGSMCRHVPGLPLLPEGQTVSHVMAIPNIFKIGAIKTDITVNWVLFDDDDDMKSWLDLVTTTLPPFPKRTHAESQNLHHHHDSKDHVQTETPQQCVENSSQKQHPDTHDTLFDTKPKAHSPGDKDDHHDDETKRHHDTGKPTLLRVVHLDPGKSGELVGDQTTVGRDIESNDWHYGWEWDYHPFTVHFEDGDSGKVITHHDVVYGYRADDIGLFEAGDYDTADTFTTDEDVWAKESDLEERRYKNSVLNYF